MVSCASTTLERFSKIGGEMVPHIKVEDLLQNWPAPRKDLCRHRVPMRRKANASSCCTRWTSRTWKNARELGKTTCPPVAARKDQFLRIETLPYLVPESSTCAKRAIGAGDINTRSR